MKGWLFTLCLVAAVVFGFSLGGAFHAATAKPAAATTRPVTVSPSPASCSTAAHIWQEIALRESRVAALAATGHHHRAGVAAQRADRFARSHAHLIRNGECT